MSASALQNIIAEIRKYSRTDRESGGRFEEIIRRWFLESSCFPMISQAWLWADFARRAGVSAADLGIDIVLETTDGGLWAVQCKLFDAGTRVDLDMVSHFLGNQGRSFHLGGEMKSFSRFVWVDTDAVWGKNAEVYVRGRDNFTRIGMGVLEESNVDWDAIARGKKSCGLPPKKLRNYQKEVLEQAAIHFRDNKRGKIIMACGTGKTLTSQRIAEAVAGTKGSLVLYCVPSIALLAQTYQLWADNAAGEGGEEAAKSPAPIYAIGVCSDNKAMTSAKRGKSADKALDDLEESAIDSVLPATTTESTIVSALEAARGRCSDRMCVVFSTYQSLEVVSRAQKEILRRTGGEYGAFDLIICDEAHRTTGAAREGQESSFMRIHDDAFICGRRRLYMTATPRIYSINAKQDARKAASDALVCSMDDENTYGAEIARISFGRAVNLGCLSDYKVIILTVDPKDLPEGLRRSIEDPNRKEIDLDITTRLVGAIHGLSKKLLGDGGRTLAEDPRPCTRALLFASVIGDPERTGSSRNIEAIFPEVSRQFLESRSEAERGDFVSVEARHVDGTMNSSERSAILRWLAEDGGQNDRKNAVCRVVTNVRCLSEGVDVPALDAVVFMAPKKSQIDIVQSVGRVMRNFRRGEAGGKKYGYIILPVALRPGEDVGKALADNERFREVWNVLCALRSHDENFNAQVNALRLDKGAGTQGNKIVVAKAGDFDFESADENAGDRLEETKAQYLEREVARQMDLFRPDQEKIYAALVDKVGNRTYWETWASDVGRVALSLLDHMNEIIARSPEVQAAFDRYLAGLRENINPSISRQAAAEMLAQHLVIGPVFDALFADYKFNQNNAVSRTLADMVRILKEHGLGKDTTSLDAFYASIQNQVGSITTTEGRQQLIKDIYNRFFSVAFPKTTERLGIVYTPVECVDFIIHSVEALMQKEFGRSLTDENVHILDPFVGTGTFMTRLLQSGIIRPEDLTRKYQNELHCNEIVLLAYYVADVNIETVFHSIAPQTQYRNYDNICLTDTFEMYERGQLSIEEYFKGNTEQIERQRRAPIQVIIGNPPYSVGQKNANDNNQNLKYEKLDSRIEQTYVAGSNSTNKNAMYDSYIRAFRWASDRIEQNPNGGIIGFITNGGWIEGNAAAGMRQALVKEFDSIYVLDLRGDQRTQGELSRKEGGKIFGSGSRAKVCMTFLVKHNVGNTPP